MKDKLWVVVFFFNVALSSVLYIFWKCTLSNFSKHQDSVEANCAMYHEPHDTEITTGCPFCVGSGAGEALQQVQAASGPRQSSSSAKVTPSTCGEHGFVLESLHIPLRFWNKSVPSSTYNVSLLRNSFWPCRNWILSYGHSGDRVSWASILNHCSLTHLLVCMGVYSNALSSDRKVCKTPNSDRSEVQVSCESRWPRVLQPNMATSLPLSHPAAAHDVPPGTTVCGSTTLTFHTAMCWLT